VSFWGFRTPLHREALTFITVTEGRPVDGIPQRTESETEVAGWHVEPIGTSEQVLVSSVVTARWRASGPLTRAARASGKVRRANGDVLQVEGEPQHFDSGGPLDHTELVLVRWGGA
jgi:hypothetical protein